jgi:glucose/arabinose dehydrogenase
MMKLRAVLFAAALLAMAFQTPPSLRVVVVATGLQSPVAFVQDPTDAAMFYAVEQAGRIRTVHNGVVGQDFLDLRGAISAGGERGLLGLAFAPDVAQSGRFFVNFTNQTGDTVIARFRRTNALAADPSSRFDLRWGAARSPVIPQPYSNHNGGHLAFGPDNYLYIGLGDGGSGNDPEHRAQNPSSLLGKFLRIDVNVPDAHPAGYVVPSDNPFVRGGAVAAQPEIWSFGVRNPWRFSFDPPSLGGTGALVFADVGQGSWEEIDHEPPGRGGRNYGWRNREGAHVNVQNLPPAFQPLTDPIHEYGRSLGQSVTGGYVYRGRSLGARFRGRYFFADFVSGRVWSLALTINSGTGEATASDVIDHTADLGGTSTLGNISSFGVDARGEIYIVSHNRGTVFRLIGLSAPGPLRIIR